MTISSTAAPSANRASAPAQGRGIHRLDQITNWLIVAIIAIPFLISAGSLTTLAADNHIAFPLLYPLMVDGGLLIFKALALRASLHGRRDWYSWGAASTLTAISVLLNVLHVPATAETLWLARFMSALPPLVILAAFVAVSRRVEENAHAQGLQNKHDQLVADIAARQTAFDKLVTQQNDTLSHLEQERLAEIDKKATQRQAEIDNFSRTFATRWQSQKAEYDQLLDTVAGLQRDIATLRLEKQALSHDIRQETVSLNVSPTADNVTRHRPDGRDTNAPFDTTRANTAVAKPSAHDPFDTPHGDIRDNTAVAKPSTPDPFDTPDSDTRDNMTLSTVGTDGTPDTAELTERQRDILDLLAQGLDKPEIATAVGISLRTVYREIDKLNGLVTAVTS